MTRAEVVRRARVRFMARQRCEFICPGCGTRCIRTGESAYHARLKHRRGERAYCCQSCYAANVKWKVPHA